MQYIYLVLPGIITANTYISLNLYKSMRLDIVEIGSANGLYFDVDPISTACRNRVRVEIESVYRSSYSYDLQVSDTALVIYFLIEPQN